MTDKLIMTNARRHELIRVANDISYYCFQIIDGLARKHSESEYYDYSALKTAKQTLMNVVDRARELKKTEE